MKICILGAGSLGSAIGGAFDLAGNEVHLVARPDHVKAVNERGLVLVADGGERVAHPVAHETPAGIGECDLVIVLCKAFDTRQAAEQAKAVGIVGPNTTVMSLQNGLGMEEVLSEVFGADRMIGGRTYIGGMLLAPGRVQANIAGKRTYIGGLAGETGYRVRRIAAAFESAGMGCSVSADIGGVIWDKLLVNVATGAICAITGLSYEGVYSRPDLRETGIAAVQEGMDVAAALGIGVSYESPAEAWDLAREGLPGNFKPSMLQSLEHGRKTEVDYIAGAVARAGEQTGVPTPVNRTLTALVHGIEQFLGVK